MEKLIYLNPVPPVTPPDDAIFRKDKAFIHLDLKAVFHEGYIDQYGVVPEITEQPLSFYERFISDTEELRFEPHFLGIGDYRPGESHKFGRYFGRGYLATHQGYTWFAHVKEAMKFPQIDPYSYGSWSVERPKKGDLMPDWLIARDNQVAVAEAKGTLKSIGPKDKKAWYQQARNIHLYNGPRLTSVKGWVVATRFATVEFPRVSTELYVEDPETPGESIVDDNIFSLRLWIAQLHTARNLFRLGQNRLAIRLLQADTQFNQTPVTVPIYRCIIPGLENNQFIGTPHVNVNCNVVTQFLLGILTQSKQLVDLWRSQMDLIFSQGFFDGLDVDVVSRLRHQHSDVIDSNLLNAVNRYPNVSLRPDGSLLCGLDVIEPLGVITIR